MCTLSHFCPPQALRFVRLSDEAVAVNWAALEEEAEQKALGSGAAWLCSSCMRRLLCCTC